MHIKLDIYVTITSHGGNVGIYFFFNNKMLRYTWRGPNKKQSRLDYFLVSSDIEYFVQSSAIGLSYRSDHNPVSIVLKFLNQTRDGNSIIVC